jgi:STE24 endopeptidase
VFASWIALSCIQVLVLILNTKVFIKIFNKLTPLPEGSLKEAILALALKTGFKAKAIYSMDGSKRSSKLNAFFSGFGPTREIALFDTLLAKLNQRQILAVLAHEIGHAKHFDEIKILIEQILIFGVNAMALNLVIGNADIVSSFGFTGSFFAFSLILFTLLFEPFDFLLGLPTNWLSRKAEYAADAFAVRQGYKVEMLEALKVLVTENFANLTPHPLQVLLTYSHPPMSVRLAAIEKLPG